MLCTRMHTKLYTMQNFCTLGYNQVCIAMHTHHGLCTYLVLTPHTSRWLASCSTPKIRPHFKHFSVGYTLITLLKMIHIYK